MPTVDSICNITAQNIFQASTRYTRYTTLPVSAYVYYIVITDFNLVHHTKVSFRAIKKQGLHVKKLFQPYIAILHLIIIYSI